MRTSRQNKGRPANAYKRWEDKELRLILSTVPTRENITKWAAFFSRSEAAIEVIYRWAYSSKAHVDHHVEHNNVTGIPARAWRIAKDLGIVTRGCP